MKKDQLVRALSRSAPSSRSAKTNNKARSRARPNSKPQGRKPALSSKPVAKKRGPDVERRIAAAHKRTAFHKNLATRKDNDPNDSSHRDRLVVLVRDPFWLQVHWDLSRHGVDRAQAAMGQDWHTARPVLRVFEIAENGTTSTAETIVRHIEIHGGVSNWYVDVLDPPKSYRLDIGYLASSGRYFMLARSNVVSTPKAGASDSLDENWSDVAQNFEKIYAMSGGNSPTGANTELTELFEERLRRPMGNSVVSPVRVAEGLLPNGRRQFDFHLDAELIVFGSTEPTARVTLQGDPVKLRSDGTFTVRFSMPNCRQVIPAVATSADGIEQRTIVLAVERNTKVMEPLLRDGSE
jgi:hypothetical protein